MRAIFWYSVPTALLLFCWLTMGVSAAYDNGRVTAFGFPLSWYTPSLVSSGGYEVAAGRAIVDLAIYALLSQLVWIALAMRLSIKRGADRILKGLLWAGAVLSLLLCAGVFTLDPHVTWWTLSPPAPENAPKTYFLSVGLQPRAAPR
ncbi:MAG TPA: hypothetical protein VKU19_19430 [Bryobacteraceae bacterium]|nr:hypothetical protein [Bryobacteraceae bacterium]